MKKLVVLMLIIGFFVAQGAIAHKAKALDLPIKHLYAAPFEESNLIYDIPVEVKLLDVSEDGNWYKVKIAYNLGPFSYSYVGWAPIPVSEILAEREAREIASLYK